jgi:hypothetical protein
MILSGSILKTTSITLMLMLIGLFSHAQCKHDFKAHVENDDSKANGGKIYLTSDLRENVTLRLYKIDSTNDLIAEKTVTQSQLSNTQPVFENLSPATYLIQCVWNNCVATIGGTEGLEIKKSPKK